jgi:hypothetical protein
MPTIKIIDTCTLINIFHLIEIDLSPFLEEYYTVITDQVVSEYTKKIPRPIPKCLSVIGMNETDRALMDEMELLFPQLGVGERSVFVYALGVASVGLKVVVLSDDQKAIKKFSDVAKNENIMVRFPGSENIIWGDTLSLIGKFVDDGKIQKDFLDRACQTLGCQPHPTPPKPNVV